MPLPAAEPGLWVEPRSPRQPARRGEVQKLAAVASPAQTAACLHRNSQAAKPRLPGSPEFLGTMGLADGIFNKLPGQFLALRNWRAVAEFGEELGNRARPPLCWAVGASPVAEWFLLRGREKLYG